MPRVGILQVEGGIVFRNVSVASSAELINHRRDFHWLIDVEAGTITKHVPFV